MALIKYHRPCKPIPDCQESLEICLQMTHINIWAWKTSCHLPLSTKQRSILWSQLLPGGYHWCTESVENNSWKSGAIACHGWEHSLKSFKTSSIINLVFSKTASRLVSTTSAVFVKRERVEYKLNNERLRKSDEWFMAVNRNSLGLCLESVEVLNRRKVAENWLKTTKPVVDDVEVSMLVRIH